MKYVLIGNSAAATACIEGIRSVDKSGEIVVISDENRPAYGRPLISYALLGKIKKENMDYRDKSFYEENGVKLMLGKKVEKIDPQKKCVYLQGGKSVGYGKLLVSTGSRPFIPPMAGLDKVKNKFTFMTYADMEALEKVLSERKRVLVIGAGLIGLKCVEGIADRVKKITVVDMAERILPSVLDKDGAEFVQKSLERKGVEFILGDSAQSFEANKATLKSGKVIDFDILVTAIGVRPNVEIFKDAGGEVNRGIVVGDDMKTSIPDIYAAGDCAEGYDKLLGSKRILALLPNAAFQGRCAGVNMAGGKDTFSGGIAMNALGLFDCHMITAGVYEGECFLSIDDAKYKKLFVKDGKLVGYILIGEIENAGIYTALIREQTPLSDLDWSLMAQRPQLMAFSQEERSKKLASKV